MEPKSGVLILQRGLDRESSPVHHFLVQAVDKGTPQLSSTAHVLVTVLDMNDNAPVFEQPSQRCVVTESAARGHFVTLMAASDTDVSDADKLTYSMVDGNDLQVFAINSASGVVTVWNSQKLRETNHHVLNISVSDGVFTAYTRLLVSITPINAHSPTFRVAQYSARIQENAAPKTSIAQVAARDVDSGRYGDVTYHFIGDRAHKFFRINENTGEVWTSEMFDREAQSEYSFTVMAMDIGGRTGFTTLHVTVADDNDNKPVFVQSVYRVVMEANTTLGTGFLRVEAEDVDSGVNGTVSYDFHISTPPDTMEAFSLNAETGELSLKKNIPELGVYWLAVGVYWRAVGVYWRAVGVYWRAVGVYWRAVGVYWRAVGVYWRAVGVYWRAVGVYWRAVGVYWRAVGVYWLSGVTACWVCTGVLWVCTGVLWGCIGLLWVCTGVLWVCTGVLWVCTGVLWGWRSFFEFFVVGQDGGRPGLHSHVPVSVRIVDPDLKVPEFMSKIYTLTVPEDTQPGTQIGSVGARFDGELEYSIDWGGREASPPVSVSPVGRLTLTALLDHEKDRRLSLIVTATPTDRPELASSTNVVLEVQDVNDESPAFESEKYYISVAENTPSGSNVVKVCAHDGDTGSNSEIRYILKETSPLVEEPVFTLDPYSGWLSLNQELDAEIKSTYELTVIAKDNGLPQRSSTAMVVIEVKDYNDNPPQFASTTSTPQVLLLTTSCSV
ncbi:Protocadherin Fat 1 [Chionoecetes opilio]|uniref:Protocadherin Fat 1 n=1 Tax=Chionoecetes opilio TaxID=41210 RepID=A0A8J4YD62_CHIOP|nr:Protocadherin Fat 1 [Chionoecetes opilio]